MNEQLLPPPTIQEQPVYAQQPVYTQQQVNQSPYSSPPPQQANIPVYMPYPQNTPNINVNVVQQQQQTKCNPTIIAQVQTGSELLNCNAIYCHCIPPRFRCFQCCCGIAQLILPGSGLQACCCYGCGKPDCCSVWCAGFFQSLSFCFIVGWISSCCVGCKMMC